MKGVGKINVMCGNINSVVMHLNKFCFILFLSLCVMCIYCNVCDNATCYYNIVTSISIILYVCLHSFFFVFSGVEFYFFNVFHCVLFVLTQENSFFLIKCFKASIVCLLYFFLSVDYKIP